MAENSVVASQMSKNNILSLAGVAVGTILLNFLLFKKDKTNKDEATPQQIKEEIENEKKDKVKHFEHLKTSHKFHKQEQWGNLLIQNIKQGDDLLLELEMMDRLLFEVSRINNLIVDLGYGSFETFPCPLVANQGRKSKDQPFLNPEALVAPGEFVIKQCVFKPGKILELQKKYLRAGPRATQYFDPKDVNADIVCLGKVCPGINTVVRQIVLILKNIYKVPKVTGVKNSFKGYYDNTFVNLTPELVETIHHHGGSYLGLCWTELYPNKIIDSLIKRNVNQVYLIGANATLKAAKKIYDEIKKRKLSITITVLLKGIHRDIPIFDTCFGFQTAAEVSSQILQRAYEHSHANFNGVSLVKLPGFNSGFLTANTVLSTINANFCLVPQFPFDVHGPKGLLNSICDRVRHRGSCTVVYSQGAEKALRDCCLKKQQGGSAYFDRFLKQSIESALRNQKMEPYHVAFFDGIEIARSSAANSIDTKLCCQIALSSVQGMMCGYTNFATGHLANKNGIISVDQLLNSQAETNLLDHQEIWERVRMATGQSTLLND